MKTERNDGFKLELGSRTPLRHGDSSLPHRTWLKDPVRNDLPMYVERIKGFMQTESTGWAGPLNASRQEHQNDHEGFSFADHWAYYMKAHIEKYGTPQTVLEISIGPDAALLENHLNILPNSTIWVIEENPKNIEAAKNRLTQKGYKLDNVVFVEGNAANPESYKKIPYLGLIATNNLIQHIPTGYTEMQKLMGKDGKAPLSVLLDTLSQVLAKDGTLIVGDLAVGQWDINPAKGYEDDPEVQKMAGQGKFYIYGGETPDGRKFPGAMALGWPISRMASAFKNENEIAETINKFSSGKLAVIDGSLSTLQIKNMGPKDPATIITAHIPATLVAGIRGAIEGAQKAKGSVPEGSEIAKILEARIPQLVGAEKALTAMGLSYLEMLKDKRIAGVFPAHYIQGFRNDN